MVKSVFVIIFTDGKLSGLPIVGVFPRAKNPGISSRL